MELNLTKDEISIINKYIKLINAKCRKEFFDNISISIDSMAMNVSCRIGDAVFNPEITKTLIPECLLDDIEPTVPLSDNPRADEP